MRSLFILPLLLLPETLFAQSPFDGTWIIDSSTAKLPQKPSFYLLHNGMFRNSGTDIKADGSDQKVPATGYWDTVSVRIVDEHRVEIISKKAGKTMFAELDIVSPDGNTLTQLMKDTIEAGTVTIETVSKRVGPGPPGSHPISGSWQAYKVNRSKNGSVITYRCTAEGFSAETPLGEKFDAKFDGKDYLVEDDPAHSTVSVKLLAPNMIEQIGKRNGKVVGILRLTVMPDGKSIRATYENKENNTSSSYEMRKLP